MTFIIKLNITINNIWTISFKRLVPLSVNDKVDITFSDADVLVFDDEGNRVYA
nr:hypothetical protein [Mycoplasmopsis bovis]